MRLFLLTVVCLILAGCGGAPREVVEYFDGLQRLQDKAASVTADNDAIAASIVDGSAKDGSKAVGEVQKKADDLWDIRKQTEGLLVPPSFAELQKRALEQLDSLLAFQRALAETLLTIQSPGLRGLKDKASHDTKLRELNAALDLLGDKVEEANVRLLAEQQRLAQQFELEVAAATP